jgi:hypothetical protein
MRGKQPYTRSQLLHVKCHSTFPYQNRANTMQAVLSHPEDEYSTDSML